MENLYDYVFWYNPFVETWYAIPTKSYIDFFNGNKLADGVISSDKIETLISVINNLSLVE